MEYKSILKYSSSPMIQTLARAAMVATTASPLARICAPIVLDSEVKYESHTLIQTW